MKKIKKLLIKVACYILKKCTQIKTNDDSKIQKDLEKICFEEGHNWVTDHPKDVSKLVRIEDRTYCSRCGMYYHKHDYKFKNEN